MTCFLAQFSDTPCDGQLVRVHLLPRQLLKREGFARFIYDERTWVPGCGGITGIGGHHGMMDAARTLRIPRHALPAGVEEVAAEMGLAWYLEREYGPLEVAA